MSDMKHTESETKRLVETITGKEYRELNRTARPDMTNAGTQTADRLPNGERICEVAPNMTNAWAAECITDFIEHFDELGFYAYYKDALEKAVTALNGDLGWEFIIFMIEKHYPEDLFGDCDDLGGRTLRVIRLLDKERAALRGWVRSADKAPTEAEG